MVLNYFGDGCFRLQSGEVSLLLNPQNNRLKADVILRTLTLTGETQDSPAEEVRFPGEYEMKDIAIQGWPLKAESSGKFLKTIYRAFWEDMSFLFLGHLAKTLPAELLEEMGEVDVVFIPTGDEHFIGPEDAAKLLKQLEPKVVIPAYYKSPQAFLKAVNGEPEKMEKFVFRRKDLGEGGKRRTIVLEAKA